MDSFVETKLNHICDEIKDKGEIGIIPYLEIGNINIKAKDYLFEKKASVKGCKIARKDDVLISRVRPTRGAIVVVKENELMVSNAFTILRPLQPISSRFIFYNLAWNQKFLTYLGDNCTGTLYPTVSDKIVVDYLIPIFSFNEQKRIVEKLDSILPRVQNAKSRLEKIPVILKKFRQSVLAAACSGRLTEDWREGRFDTIASQSLSDRDITGSMSSSGDRVPEGCIEDTGMEKGLPEWGTKKFENVGTLGRGRSKHRPRNDPKLFNGEYPFIQTGDIAQSGGLITSHSQTYKVVYI